MDINMSQHKDYIHKWMTHISVQILTQWLKKKSLNVIGIGDLRWVHWNPDTTCPDTMLYQIQRWFFLDPKWFSQKITVGLSRHKKFIYFHTYHRILTKIFSLVEKNRCGKPFLALLTKGCKALVMCHRLSVCSSVNFDDTFFHRTLVHQETSNHACRYLGSISPCIHKIRSLWPLTSDL